MRNQDILELLEHTQAEIQAILSELECGKLNKVKVKNTLENFRSVLDYSAQDIHSLLKSRVNKKIPEKVYFPYGQRENHFKGSIKRNLPGLSQHLPKIHLLINDLQPFKSGDTWLVELCGLTNDAKHNNLSKTENKKSKAIHQGGIPLIEFSGNANIQMSGNTVNGVLQDSINIDSKGNTSIKVVSGQTLITETNKILFQGKKIEVAPFLGKCQINLESFIKSLSVELANA